MKNIEAELENVPEERERELRNELEQRQNQLTDVEDFGERIDNLIIDGFEPDRDAGIWENIKQVDEYGILSTPLDKL